MAKRRRGSGRKTKTCGHYGKGLQCHRCAHADFLEKAAKADKKYMTNKKAVKPNKPKVWAKDEMLEEAARLRANFRRTE